MLDTETKDKLFKLITNRVSYDKYDSNNKALGCMLPIYTAYPNGARFDFPTGNTNMKEYISNLLDANCYKLNEKDTLEEGDIITINIPFGLFHVALYLGDNKIIHCSQTGGAEIMRFSIIRDRIEGRYRYNG